MSSTETDLKTQLESYESELQTVDSCLACTPADDPNYKDLQELKQQLEEVITLTKDQYLEIQKRKLYEELGLNSTTGATDENQATSSTSHAHVDNTEDDISKQIEGKQCSVPYRTQSGKVEYHNAVVMCIEENEATSESETINVRVFFCNPVIEKMKPCAYFMRGECKFNDKDCKYSHGYVCPLTSLGEPIELVVNEIQRDYRCLARTPASDLWREAVVEKTLDDHRYLVQVSREEQPLILELENIAPICEDSDDSSDSDSDSESEDPYVNSHQWETIDFEASPIGAWETHTRGIASKLMKKMGYVWGQGLGKESQGLVEPIQPIFYPERKSLDACIAIRKKTSVTAEKKKAKLEKAVAKQIANGYHKVKPENVFDFLNDKICKLKKPKAAPDDPSKSDQKLAASYKVTTDQKLNVEAFKISEDLKKAESELFHLQAGMFRANSKATKAGFKSKLDEKRKLVDSLRRKEKLVESEQKSRNSHRKLTTF